MKKGRLHGRPDTTVFQINIGSYLMYLRKIPTFFGYAPEAVAMVLVATTFYLLFTYTLPFNSPEYVVRWLPNAVSNGINLQVIDWFRGFDVAAYDGGLRPRFISHSLMVLSTKLRLWLYQFFIPFPNLSIVFIISIIASPFLYFFFAKKMLRTNSAAFWATCLHLTSVGFISSTALMHQAGKTLVQPTVLLLFLLLATLHIHGAPRYFGQERPRIVAVVMILNFIGLSVDDTYAVMACVAVVLFYRILLPRSWDVKEIKKSAGALFLFFVPFVLFTVFVFFVPYILRRIPGSEKLFVDSSYQDYFSYLFNTSKQLVGVNLEIFSNIWTSFHDVTLKYFSLWPLNYYLSFYDFPWPQLINVSKWGLALLLLLPFFTVSKNGKRLKLSLNKTLVNDRLLWGLPIAIIVFVVASTVIQYFHSKIINGFFYGSMASLLIPLLLTAILMQWKGVLSTVGKVGILMLMVITAVNGLVSTRGSSWEHGQYIYRLKQGAHPDHYYPVMFSGDFPGLKLEISDSSERKWSASKMKPTFWSPQFEQKTRNRLYSVWQEWKDGKAINLSEIGPWDAENMWFFIEMTILQRGGYKVK